MWLTKKGQRLHCYLRRKSSWADRIFEVKQTGHGPIFNRRVGLSCLMFECVLVSWSMSVSYVTADCCSALLTLWGPQSQSSGGSCCKSVRYCYRCHQAGPQLVLLVVLSPDVLCSLGGRWLQYAPTFIRCSKLLFQLVWLANRGANFIADWAKRN